MKLHIEQAAPVQMPAHLQSNVDSKDVHVAPLRQGDDQQ